MWTWQAGRGRGFTKCSYFYIRLIMFVTKGRGSQKCPKYVLMVYEWPLKLFMNQSNDHNVPSSGDDS